MKLHESWINKSKSIGQPVKSELYLRGVNDHNISAVNELQQLADDLKEQGSSQYIGVLRALNKIKYLKVK